MPPTTDHPDAPELSILDETLPAVEDAADLPDDEPDTELDTEPESTEAEAPQEPEAPELEACEPPSPALEELLGEIAEAESLCSHAERAVNSAKAILKEAKAEYDGCVLKLRDLAKAVLNDQDRPLFAGLGEGEPEAAEAEEDNDPRLAEPISVLDLPAGVVSKLSEAGVETIGGLEQLREDITFDRKEWPKGIGPAKVDLIETAVVEWLAKNQEDITPEPVAEPDDAAPGAVSPAVLDGEGGW